MSIATELNRLERNRQSIVSAVNAKGGELAENAPLNAIASAIEALPSGGGEIVIEGEITIVSTTTSVGIDIYDNRITEDNFLYGAVWSDKYIAEPQPYHVIFITAYNSNPSNLICGTSQYTVQSTTTITTNTGGFNLFAGRVLLRAAATRQWAAGDIYKYKIILKS